MPREYRLAFAQHNTAQHAQHCARTEPRTEPSNAGITHTPVFAVAHMTPGPCNGWPYALRSHLSVNSTKTRTLTRVTDICRSTVNKTRTLTQVTENAPQCKIVAVLLSTSQVACKCLCRSRLQSVAAAGRTKASEHRSGQQLPSSYHRL